jgi:hypothetical protein
MKLTKRQLNKIIKEFKVTGDYDLDDVGLDFDFDQEMQEKESNQIELWFYAVASMPAGYHNNMYNIPPRPYKLDCYYFKSKSAFKEDRFGRGFPLIDLENMDIHNLPYYKPLFGYGPSPVIPSDHYKYNTETGLSSDEEALKREFCKGNIDTLLIHNYSGPGHEVIQKGPYFNVFREEQTPTFYLYYKDTPDDVIITCKNS